jgi:hypothetical protein
MKLLIKLMIMQKHAHRQKTALNRIYKVLDKLKGIGESSIPNVSMRFDEILYGPEGVWKGQRRSGKPVAMTLEEAFASVKPLTRPENYKRLREIALEEKVEKIIREMNQ